MGEALRDWALVRAPYVVAAVINVGPSPAFMMVIVSVSYLSLLLLASAPVDQAISCKGYGERCVTEPGIGPMGW